jgi:hypothetical protein
VAEPKSLAVVHQNFERGGLAIAEDEDSTDEWIVFEGLLTEPSQAIDPPAKISGFDGHEDLHLRGDLEHG